MSQYISSITSNYGDVDNVKKDVKALNEILMRQGSRLLIDVITNHIGEIIVKYNMTDEQRNNIVNSVLKDFNDSMSERT